jgi:pilus assembly protein FimV
MYLAGGAAGLLALGGLGFMLARRKKTAASAKVETDFGATTGRITAPVAPSPETGDFTSTVAKEVSSLEASEDDVDPISEADLFLNFGRDVQAEEILKDALQSNPSNHQVSLKLLGIYANRKDANSFASIARQLQDSGDDAAWQQAAAMGAKLEPSNPMYAGAATIEDADSATMQTAAMSATPDFVLDAEPEVQQAPPDLDFDLGGGDVSAPGFAEEATKTMVLDADELSAAQTAAMDFDLTSTNPSMLATDFNLSEPATEQVTGGSANIDDLVFDVTSTNPSLTAASSPIVADATPANTDAGMDFVLDFPTETAVKSAPASTAMDMDLSDISLNLDDVVTPAAVTEDNHDERWHEVATKLDLAKAYQEMGDAVGAREILEEVLQEGDEQQCEAAKSLIAQL